ncbi:DUF3592 domain-containing protein [Alcanivorax sp. S6407]|uniref:DUF3592 domain-containing protein n=1 Tax=Alcanivorax sp. S6407 TaxID=2926424 RepID=UPI001FF6AC05|nr:DUF3592 domain-containing protein [Alcanivorax sp. S6407]MCK0154387.1 DUF3592 domain-containing protein [Alcanivorax sp. S6407]
MKIIGYLIGAAFLSMILLGPAVGLYLVSKDTFAALSYTGTEQGEIVDCRSFRTGGQNSRYSRVPVVQLGSDRTISGTVDEIRYFWECDDQIGTTVEVIYDIQNPSNAKINTFIEMWFLPIVIGAINLIWYSAVIAGYVRKYRNRGR